MEEINMADHFGKIPPVSLLLYPWFVALE